MSSPASPARYRWDMPACSASARTRPGSWRRGGTLDPLAAIAIGSLGAGAVGFMLSYPAGRVREVYLAMMTLGFGMVFYEVIREWQDVTGGVMGLSGVPSVVLRNLTLLGVRIDGGNYLRFVLVVTLVLLLILRNVSQSKLGRSMVAVQANAVAAASIGISPSTTKRLAYCISGAVAGLAGALYAHLVGYLGPDSFGLPRSIEVLVISIVGGLGSITGQVLSAIAFTVLPERLQAFAEYQFIVYGLILSCTLVLMPKGIAGLLLPAGYASSSRRAEPAATGDVPLSRHAVATAGQEVSGGVAGGRRHRAIRRPRRHRRCFARV